MRKPYKIEFDGREVRLRNLYDVIQHLEILLEIETGKKAIITKNGHEGVRGQEEWDD